MVHYVKHRHLVKHYTRFSIKQNVMFCMHTNMTQNWTLDTLHVNQPSHNRYYKHRSSQHIMILDVLWAIPT